MIFHSIDFILFFIVILSFYWLLNRKWQNLLLLISSYYFYGYVQHWFLILIFSSTLIDFFLGIAIEKFDRHRKSFLILSIVANLSLLGLFKYFNFFAENFSVLLSAMGLGEQHTTLQIILPVGISFYTFQSLSYTIDIYRGRLYATKNFVDFALFVSFFPQLVAGPIERATHLLPQVLKDRRINWRQVEDGILLILWGYLKKLVVADHAALIANKAFALSDPHFSLMWVGVLAFGIQIFADFSAYSDIARGIARFFGFDLMRNFDHPYLSSSMREFWTRWHISLSGWFKDYVYIPLGGGRKSSTRNILITFLLSGFWHGASWNFIGWGGYHGVLTALERKVNFLGRVYKPFKILLVFILVQIGWLFFREHDMHQILKALTLKPWEESFGQFQVSLYLFALLLLYSIPLVALSFEHKLEKTRVYNSIALRCLLGFFIFLGILTLRSEILFDFIYFQF